MAELKENLLRDMDNGNRDEHLFRLIRVFKRNNIPYCRGIASVLFDILEDHQGGFSQEHLVSLRKDIIEGLYTFKLRQQGNSLEIVDTTATPALFVVCQYCSLGLCVAI